MAVTWYTSFDGDAMHQDVDGLPFCGGPPMDSNNDKENKDVAEKEVVEQVLLGNGKGKGQSTE